MRTIFVGMIGAALCGFASGCSSSGTSSVVAPTALGTPAASAAAVGSSSQDNNPRFWSDNFTLQAGSWTGTTTPYSSPDKGHKGDLTLVFHDALFVSATLNWERIPNSADACHLEAVPATSGFPMTVSCADSSTLAKKVIVYPGVTTIYTFVATKQGTPEPSQGWPKRFAADPVVVPTTEVTITATWTSTLGPGDDDPGVVYIGHVHPPLNGEIQVDADASPAPLCGLSGNRPNPANHFHAATTALSNTTMSGSYDGIACTVDHGTFTLTRQ